MIDRSAEWVAAAASARLVAGAATPGGPSAAAIDTRAIAGGELFAGLAGTHTDGGRFAAEAFAAGAWGVLVGADHAAAAVAAAPAGAVVLAADDPLAALQALATTWRRELGATVIGVTGSTGKTSTKDILAALLGGARRTHASVQNMNTEIGVPLTILAAPAGTEMLVLEFAMRGEGQIAELVAIAEPDVGLIVNVGPVHLELLGTVERVAAAKAELIRDLEPGAVCVVPAGEALLEPHLRGDLRTLRFGPGGDVRLVSMEAGHVEIDADGVAVALDLTYAEPYNVLNTVAAVGACVAAGVTPSGLVEPSFSALRGEVVELDGGVTVVNDCYNANPMSMRAALQHLAETPAERRVAILGAMAELGRDGPDFHDEIGRAAAQLGVDVLITVGEPALAYADSFGGESYAAGDPNEAAALLAELARPGDRVLIKGSRSAGLERVLA